MTNRTLENWKTFPPYQIHPNSCSKWCWESNLIILVLFKNPKIYDTSELIFLSIDGTKIMTCLKALLLRLSSIVELVIHDSVQSQFSNLGCFRCVSNSWNDKLAFMLLHDLVTRLVKSNIWIEGRDFLFLDSNKLRCTCLLKLLA